MGPLSAIVLDSFRKFENGEWIYTWYWYDKLFSWSENNYFLSSLWNSLRIGLGSALISSLCGIGLVSLIAYKKGGQRRFWEVLLDEVEIQYNKKFPARVTVSYTHLTLPTNREV